MHIFTHRKKGKRKFTCTDLYFTCALDLLRKFCSLTDSFPNEENLEWSKLKAFADDKINFIEMIIYLSYRVENIVGKGKNAGYQ